MHHQLVFALLLVAVCLSTACEKSPKQARRELVKKGYSYARDGFAESLRKADSEAVGEAALRHLRGRHASDPMLLCWLLRLQTRAA